MGVRVSIFRRIHSPFFLQFSIRQRGCLRAPFHEGVLLRGQRFSGRVRENPFAEVTSTRHHHVGFSHPGCLLSPELTNVFRDPLTLLAGSVEQGVSALRSEGRCLSSGDSLGPGLSRPPSPFEGHARLSAEPWLGTDRGLLAPYMEPVRRVVDTSHVM